MPTGTLGSPRGEDLFGIVLDFTQKLGNGSITPWQAKRFLRGEDSFIVPMDTASQLTRWKDLYERHFGITLSPDFLGISDRAKGLDRLIVVAARVRVKQVFTVLGEHFTVLSSYNDFDRAGFEDERSNTVVPYAIWTKNHGEADKDNINKSANFLKKSKVPTMTLLERLLYELMFFTETGNHLDVAHETLCAGSRDENGRVPRVLWNTDDSQMFVGWQSAGASGLRERARTVVSLPAEASAQAG